ncbi:uncharacterized protein KD926_001444 [Aspergillus affinis]|uniref:uncharacterized protein n=1 Tax=Aspergillus affinis TaxID=1070780 RepID=UPI0022FE862A|nr:uncharacterized protein KD926_001444 [Aspergillus affinis]KAI9044214.1 hypothetical protein KD926_001444 [Aspergillus affinis]
MNPPPLPPPPQGRSLDRALYLAPTKASRAKSHTTEDPSQSRSNRVPSLTSRRSPSGHNVNDQQSQAGPKTFGLRDRKALRPSLSSTASPMGNSNNDKPSPVSLSNRRSSGLDALAAPPRRVSRRIVPSDLTFQSPVGMKRDELDTGVTNTPEDQLALELGSATGGNERKRDWNPPAMDEDYEEPDLPLTPTQLGLEKLAGRPRRLLSSSPTTQRFGRRRPTDLLGQSPSKLRNVDDGTETGSSLESTIAVTRALFPEPVAKKRRLREELTADAQQLKKQIADLESWSVSLDQDDDDDVEPDVSKIISLLASECLATTDAAMRPTDIPVSSLISTLLPFSSTAPLKISAPPSPSNPFALRGKAQEKPHLTIFAPLSLKTRSDIVPDPTFVFLERHSLMFSAPVPFPPELYSISVVYETNFQDQALVSVTTPDPIPQYLRIWINSRLENPLTRLDVSGLCWGINRYWEAVLSRAYVWLQLENHHTALLDGKSGVDDIPLQSVTENLTVTNLRKILPHLQRTSMLFESEDAAIKVMLSCEITIDEWACEPQMTPGLTVSGSSTNKGSLGDKTEQESKDLFNAVIHENISSPAGSAGGLDANVVIQATNHVLGALFGVGASLSSKNEER